MGSKIRKKRLHKTAFSAALFPTVFYVIRTKNRMTAFKRNHISKNISLKRNISSFCISLERSFV